MTASHHTGLPPKILTHLHIKYHVTFDELIAFQVVFITVKRLKRDTYIFHLFANGVTL